MASMPGILTDWPWKPLGSFKYVMLAPWVIQCTYSYVFKDDEEERDLSQFLIFPFLLWRMLHSQIWITLSRYRTIKGNNRIVDKGLEFDQVDRERNWDDQILFNGILLYLSTKTLNGASNLPLWRTDGVITTILLHAGPVEFLYYWLHRALHHHYLYSRYHSHHHSSIVTEPITSVTHPFAEHIAYFVLFAIPMVTTVFTGTASVASYTGYITYIDFMNNMGHCNFELVPHCLFSIFPPLKYLMYTPSFHSLHHTQFRSNYSLFMPLYDYIYGTTDKSSDSLHVSSLKREEVPDVVHLTHLTTPESIYHLRLGFASLASKPHTSKWYLWLMWPITLWSMIVTWIYGRTFVVERHCFNRLRVQTWAIPKYTMQGEELNAYGGVYVHRHPKLKIKVVDGSSLAVAVVLNTIPKGTTQVLLRGNLTKVAYAIAFTLCCKDIQVAVLHEDEYMQLNRSFNANSSSSASSKLVLSKTYSHKIWLVGDGVSEEEQLKAAKGTVFIPYSQFPPKKLRKDCFYHYTPALSTPKSLENVHSCENWLPRRAMSAWRVAGIVHALEGWNEHECGNTMFDIDKIWEATIQHGFQPLTITSTPSKY
ncbi:hypothetical protein FNV43_RR12169 [Rhamnella rubrinervis]|uniref:Protein ECERIFERUM 1-like n=1 Tax=Rhamnella rubrinervis TaxID=2594499 RepID=A0A8K0MI10_9ROSA|nr:hypothetical protein FNV43_RR12169 [Rhamnella rubrinervis]